jgi:hypothetical protein
MPMPAETRLTMVCIWIASCPICGVMPASRNTDRMASCSAGAIARGKMMSGSGGSGQFQLAFFFSAGRPEGRASTSGSFSTGR